MSLAPIQAALDARLQALTGIDIAWQGTAYQPATGRPFLMVRMSGRNRRPMGAGPIAAHIWEGFYQINVMWPAGEGTQPALVQADALVAHFPRALTLTTTAGSRVVIENTTVQPDYDAGDWVSVPVLINWFCNVGDT
jgi:hypothetical protein